MKPPSRPTIPAIAPGTVLRLDKEDWRYGGYQLILKVDQVRPDLSAYYDNRWVWIIGRSIGMDGTGGDRVVALVRVAALPGADAAAAS